MTVSPLKFLQFEYKSAVQEMNVDKRMYIRQLSHTWKTTELGHWSYLCHTKAGFAEDFLQLPQDFLYFPLMINGPRVPSKPLVMTRVFLAASQTSFSGTLIFQQI